MVWRLARDGHQCVAYARHAETVKSVLREGVTGASSHYHDDIRRGAQLNELGLHYVDVGTSGGTHGLERGYCLMIGGGSLRGRVEHPAQRQYRQA